MAEIGSVSNILLTHVNKCSKFYFEKKEKDIKRFMFSFHSFHKHLLFILGLIRSLPG